MIEPPPTVCLLIKKWVGTKYFDKRMGDIFKQSFSIIGSIGWGWKVLLIQKYKCVQAHCGQKTLWKATWSWMMCLGYRRTHAWVEMSLGLPTIFHPPNKL
jgi:hypothetical protein